MEKNGSRCVVCGAMAHYRGNGFDRNVMFCRDHLAEARALMARKVRRWDGVQKGIELRKRGRDFRLRGGWYAHWLTKRRLNAEKKEFG